MKTPSPHIQIHLLVLLFSITAILGKIIAIPVPAFVFLRTLIAAFGMAVLLLFTRPDLLRLPERKHFALIAASGAIISLHWICFFGSIWLSNVSVALSAMASVSIFTAFTEAFHEKRSPHRHEMLLGLLVCLGLIIIVGVEYQYLAGLLVALLSSFLAAVFPVMNRSLVRKGLPVRTLLLYEMIFATLASAIIIPLVPGPIFRFAMPNPNDWLPLLTLSLVCTTFAFAWHINILKELSAYTSNLAMNMEPVYGMIFAALIFHEYQNLSLTFYGGAFLILVANFLEPIIVRRKRLRIIIT